MRRFVGFFLVVAACTGAPLSQSAGDIQIRTASRTDAIQGGTVDQTDTSVVGIMINTSQGIAICSGSLIAPNLVLTAHHCVADISSTACSSSSFGTTYSAASFAVTTSYNAAAAKFAANSFPTASTNGPTWYSVSRVAVPGNNVCGMDMAVLQLAGSITGTCPLVPRIDAPVTMGEAYRAVGFGITTPSGQTAGTRYQVSGLSVLCAGNCGAGFSASGEWEGGTTAQKGTCEGDSGGPSLDSNNQVLGTVSRGPQGACNDTIYESVAAQATWIKSQAATAATAGGYAAAGWVTGGATSNPANSYCPNSGTGGGTGTGGGVATGGGTATGGGGGTTTTCADPTTTCRDLTGQGNFACATSTGFPTGAATCSQTMACATGYSCWVTSATATTGPYPSTGRATTGPTRRTNWDTNC